VSETWRCFVGLWIGPTLRGELSASIARWRERPELAGMRWTAPETWHVTLAFLGDTEPEAIPVLEGRLAEVVSGHAPMRLPTGGLGAFPTPARARVAWYGVGDPAGRLSALASDVAHASGLEPDTFTGHVTLGRAGRQRLDLRSWAAGESPAGILAVGSIELVRSRPGGQARYESIATFSLGPSGAHLTRRSPS
jgi:RNA 2',3'-cyclic 3'-phosphodiesterase